MRLNQTLSAYIDELNCSCEKDKLIRQLEERGYTEEDFNESLENLLKFDSYLILNGLYESLCDVGESSGRALSALEPLSREAQKHDEKSIAAVANFIWVGPPTQNKRELIGALSLTGQKREQPIWFWVLDEYAAAYREILQDKKNIRVVSIESYAKKLGLSFDVNNKITLLSQIEDIKKTISMLKPQADTDFRRKCITRLYVSIVDLVKFTIAYFPHHAKYVFDADITFLQSHSGVITKKFSGMLFPKNDNLVDIWIFASAIKSDWKINKKNGGAFITQSTYDSSTTDLIQIQRNFFYFHKAILLANNQIKYNFEKNSEEEVTGEYNFSTKILLLFPLIALDRKRNVSDNMQAIISTIEKIESGSFEHSYPEIDAGLWFQEIEKLIKSKCNFMNFEHAWKNNFTPDDNGRIIKFCWYQVQFDTFNLLKVMNMSHRLDEKTNPAELSPLGIKTVENFRQVMKIRQQIGCDNSLTPITSQIRFFTPGGMSSGPETHSFNVENARLIHLCFIIRPDLYEAYLNILPDRIRNELYAVIAKYSGLSVGQQAWENIVLPTRSNQEMGGDDEVIAVFKSLEKDARTQAFFTRIQKKTDSDSDSDSDSASKTVDSDYDVEDEGNTPKSRT